MLRSTFCRYNLQFKFAARTSREEMTVKPTYFIKVWDDSDPSVCGIGECGLFPGLSSDDKPDYEDVLRYTCQNISTISDDSFARIIDYPSIVFGVETALNDLKNGGRHIIFPGLWPSGQSAITINGLVWMGSKDEMVARVGEKLAQGFRCIKFKVGGIDFDQEIDMIANVRKAFSPADLEIRLDANGGFSPQVAPYRLDRLAEYHIHSIEQPVRQGQPECLAEICRKSPIPIALDEELIGINLSQHMVDLLDTVRPAYIILKPSLCGGFNGCRKWIEAANRFGVGWWATSALESNIGLNAIAQWIATQSNDMPQGLGTGQLYHNNVHSPITLSGDQLSYDADGGQWIIPRLPWK